MRRAAFVLTIPLSVLVLGTGLAGGDTSVPAFPGAEGFGAAAVGGRGGRVIKVTTLEASGPGSLQAACEARGPRIVVFEVSGVIRGDVTIRHPRITIAGQTAPGAGITIEGMLRSRSSRDEKLHDVVVRHLRVRPRRADRKWAGGDCLQLIGIDRLIIDHVSCSWGNDENVDVCNSSNLTIQWCAIEESDTEGHTKGQHNFGMIMGYDGKNATVHHNLFAHHMRRAPLCGLEILDHRNNVIYNMRRGIYWHPPRMNRQRPGKPFRANLVGNYFKAGPDATKKGKDLRYSAIGGWGAQGAELFLKGNHFTWHDGAIDPWRTPLDQGVFEKPQVRADQPWPAPPVETHSAEEAYRLVLAQAGCWPRDVVSRRTVQEVRRGVGSWGRHDPAGGLLEGLKPGKAPVDTDADAMPDAWEKAHGLDPRDAADAQRTVGQGASADDRYKGYTYIEYYINERADQLVAGR
jgi:pectate lyase